MNGLLRCVTLSLCLASCLVMAAEEDPRTYSGRSLSEWRELIKSERIPDLGREDVISGLIEIVSDPEAPWGDRRHAALTLGRIGAPAKSAVPVLRSLLFNQEQDSVSTTLLSLKGLMLFGAVAVSASDDAARIALDPSLPLLLRATAMETLAKVGAEREITVPTLIRLLQVDELTPPPATANELRLAAADSLSLLGPAAAPALPELLRAARDPWPLLRRGAAGTLGSLAFQGDLAVSTLADMLLFDEAEEVREAAAEALGRIPPGGLKPLLQFVEDPDPSVRRLAVRGLGIAADTPPVTKGLKNASDDADPLVQVEAARALLIKVPNEPAAIHVLTEGLKHPDRHVAITAYRSLRDLPASMAAARDQLIAIQADSTLTAQARNAARRLLEIKSAQ